MKPFFLKSLTIASLMLVITASSLQVTAQSSTLIYERSTNSNINISSDNAVGCTYEIRDKKGNVVMNGKIRYAKFSIPTDKLTNGIYHFSINGNILQAFIIK